MAETGKAVVIQAIPAESPSYEETISAPKAEEVKDIEAQRAVVVAENVVPQANVFGSAPYQSPPSMVIISDGNSLPGRAGYDVFIQPRDDAMADREDFLLPCTICGTIFSFIPIVGFVTFCVNSDAPRTSMRYNLASLACAISIFVVFFNLFFFSAFGYF